MAAELPNPSLVPFVVAVTGHRDLRAQDEEALRRQVGKVLAGFRERMPSTPLLVMSGLAEGADQLVAEVALEQGASVAVVLPLPLEIYKTQMSVAGWQRFEELRAQAALEVQLPLDGRSEEELREQRGEPGGVLRGAGDLSGAAGAGAAGAVGREAIEQAWRDVERGVLCALRRAAGGGRMSRLARAAAWCIRL
jgi:hypothetical protein